MKPEKEPRPRSYRHDRADARVAGRESAAPLFAIRTRDYALVWGLGVLEAITLVAFVLLSRRVVDALNPNAVNQFHESTYNQGLFDAGIMAVLGLVMGLLRATQFSIAEKAGYEVVRRLRMAMYFHLQRMTPSHLQHRARGGLLLRLTGDLSMLRMWLSRGLLQGTVSLIVLCTGLVTIAVLDLWLMLAILGCLALAAALSVANGQSMRRATRTMRRRRSLLIGNIDEQIAAMPVIQTSGREAGEYTRLDLQNNSLTRALGRIAELRGRLRGLSTFGAMLATAAVLGIGLLEVHRGQSSAGQVIASVIIVHFLNRAVRTIGLAHDYWQRALVSREKVVDFLISSSRPLDMETLPPLKVRRGKVDFVGVTVPGILEDVTVSADRGDIIGITGPHGSGKSALLSILCRMLDPQAGEVFIDDQPLSQTAPKSISKYVGVVGPDYPILRGSVRRALTYANRSADPTEIQRVSYALKIDSMLGRNSNLGVNTWLLEGARNLPGGDRQLLAIGRALMGNPPILLLDEPMVNLDGETRDLVRELLLRHNGTVFMVSRDVDDLALCDQVWIMEEGRVASILTGAEYRDSVWQQNQGGLRWAAASAT